MLDTSSWFDFDPPQRPTGLKAESFYFDEFHHTIRVSWDRNVESDLAQYRLFARDVGGNFVELRTSQTFLEFQGINGVSYELRLSAMDMNANTSLSTDTLKITSGQRLVEQADDVFRFYNSDTGTHFYTNNAEERDSIIASLPQFNYEGNSFDAPLTGQGDVEVFRFYNRDTGTHFYTANEEERDHIIGTLDQFNFEGAAYEAYNSEGEGRNALHRFYNHDTGTHFYTANEAEKVEVLGTLPNYAYEGVAFYVDA